MRHKTLGCLKDLVLSWIYAILFYYYYYHHHIHIILMVCFFSCSYSTDLNFFFTLIYTCYTQLISPIMDSKCTAKRLWIERPRKGREICLNNTNSRYPPWPQYYSLPWEWQDKGNSTKIYSREYNKLKTKYFKNHKTNIIQSNKDKKTSP